MNLATLFDRIPAAVRPAASPEAAWAGILAAVADEPPVPAALGACARFA
ncbi:MAG TPA: hypothetical protein VFS32_06125 [Candidatus Limnocylindrales bacterium]|nr:hypothetical protein [Candidatus Limnocylindrales bacterium]